MTILSKPDLNDFAENDPLWKDVQQAHSIRYGATAFMVVPLASGRIAVLGHMRDLHAICDTWAEAVSAAESIPMNQYRRAAARAEAAKARTLSQEEELSRLLGL